MHSRDLFLGDSYTVIPFVRPVGTLATYLRLKERRGAGSGERGNRKEEKRERGGEKNNTKKKRRKERKKDFIWGYR